MCISRHDNNAAVLYKYRGICGYRVHDRFTRAGRFMRTNREKRTSVGSVANRRSTGADRGSSGNSRGQCFHRRKLRYNTTGEFIKKTDEAPLTIPEGAVVIAGTRPISSGKGAEAGIQIYCPVIIKYRDDKTNKTVTLEEVLR